MKKSKSNHRDSEPDLPAAVMERLRQVFQKPGIPEPSCPAPEQVIGCALEELDEAEAQKVRSHLLTCRDCLELFLDVRLARAEAEGLMETSLGAPQKVSRLAAFCQKIRETLEVLVKPRKLIPALAAVCLVALVFIMGREDRSRVLPPADLALKGQGASTTAPGATPPQEPAAAPPSPALPGRGLLALKRKYETATPALEKSTAATGTLAESGSIRLDFHEVPAPAGGVRLLYKADRDAFAYLLRQDSSGEITRLFSGRLKAGKTYFYPAPERLRPSDPAAPKATVYLVASEQPLAEPPAKMPDLEDHGLKQIENLFPEAAIRSLTVTLP